MQNKINEISELFSEYIKTCSYSNTTLKAKKNHFKNFYIFLLKNKIFNIYYITEKIIIEYLIHSKKNMKYPRKKLTIGAFFNKIITIKKFFDYLYQNNKLLTNPFQKITLSNQKNNLPKNILNEKEIKLVLNSPDLNTNTGIRDKAMIELCYSSGLRVSEILKLKIQEINLSKNQIHIKKTKYSKDRIIPVGNTACKYIIKYLNSVRPLLLKNSLNNYVFLSVNGTNLKYSSMNSIIKKYLKQTDINKKITWHSIRHTFATHLLKNGANITYIQKFLGHNSIKTTQIYTKIFPKDLITEIKKYHPRQKMNIKAI
jgi:integrase/recombinase XerD